MWLRIHQYRLRPESRARRSRHLLHKAVLDLSLFISGFPVGPGFSGHTSETNPCKYMAAHVRSRTGLGEVKGTPPKVEDRQKKLQMLQELQRQMLLLEHLRNLKQEKAAAIQKITYAGDNDETQVCARTSSAAPECARLPQAEAACPKLAASKVEAPLEDAAFPKEAPEVKAEDRVPAAALVEVSVEELKPAERPAEEPPAAPVPAVALGEPKPEEREEPSAAALVQVAVEEPKLAERPAEEPPKGEGSRA